MRTVIIRKVKRLGLGSSKELIFKIRDEDELDTIDALLAVAKKLTGFSFEVAKSDKEVM